MGITISRTAKQWLLALLLFGAATAQTWAASPKVFADFVQAEGEAWICDYAVKDDGLWYIRCEDLNRLRNEDPVLSDAVQSRRAEYIPLWGAPYAGGRSTELARITLCGKKALCNVVSAAL